MKKFLKKIMTMLCVCLLLFSSVARPRPVKADAGIISGGGMVLGMLNPAVLPWILLGIVACIALGYTIENWDDVQALGNSVANELKKMGHSISDFVSGTSVKVDDTLKKAIKNVGSNLGETAELPKGTVAYHGGLEAFTGEIITKSGSYRIFGGKLFDTDLYIGTKKPTGSFFYPSSYKEGKDYLVSAVTLIVDVAPTDADLKLKHVDDNGITRKVATEIVKNADGKIIQLKGAFNRNGEGIKSSFYLDYPSDKRVTVTGLSVPEFGIGEKAKTISTDKLKEGAIDSASVDKYIDTAFPSQTETVTFKPDAKVGSLSLPNLPTVSDKIYSDNQLKELDKIRAGTGVGAGTATGAQTAIGSLAGAGTGWFDKILDFLKKLLDAILGIPGLILDGLKALWDWLAKILQAILAIPAGIIDVLSKIWEFVKGIGKVIADAITGALTWAFGIDGTWLKGRINSLKRAFEIKFPAIAPLNYSIADKDTLSDMSINIFGNSYVILDGTVASKLAGPMKMVFRALAYVLMALFFARKFHKVAED